MCYNKYVEMDVFKRYINSSFGAAKSCFSGEYIYNTMKLPTKTNTQRYYQIKVLHCSSACFRKAESLHFGWVEVHLSSGLPGEMDSVERLPHVFGS